MLAPQDAAAHPSTPPTRLCELAATGSRDLRRAVANNPNTPPALLWELGAEFPEVVLANPALPLLLLAEPRLGDRLPLATLRAFVRHETVPVALLVRAARRGDFQIEQALTANAQTPRPILATLSGHAAPTVREAAQLHVANGGELPADTDWAAAAARAAIVLLKKDRSDWLAQPLIPPLLLRWLAASDAPLLREAAAKNPISPPEILTQLGADPVVQVCRAVARNPATPVAALHALSRNRSDLREAVASNPRLPSGILTRLARQIVPRLETATTTPAATQRLLQEEWRIWLAIASNPQTKAGLFEILWSPGVRATVLQLAESSHAGRPGMPSFALLKGIVTHPRTPSAVRTQLARTSIALQTCVGRDTDTSTASNAAAPVPDRLARAVQCSGERRRFAFLLHAQMPEACLVANARSLLWLERCAIAQNPQTPRHWVESLARDGNRIVRAAARVRQRQLSSKP